MRCFLPAIALLAFVSAAAAEPCPPVDEPEPQFQPHEALGDVGAGESRLMWSYTVLDGHLMLETDSAGGVYFVPWGHGASIEGQLYGRLDKSGKAQWSRSLYGAGASAMAATRNGELHILPVRALDWPNSNLAYASNMRESINRRGVGTSKAAIGTDDVEAVGIAVGRDTIVMWGGRTSGDATGQLIVATDAQGRSLWQRTPTANTTSIVVDSRGHALVLQSDGAFQRIDRAGKTVLRKQVADCHLGVMKLDGQDRIVVVSHQACHAAPTPHGCWVSQLSPQLDPQWTRAMLNDGTGCVHDVNREGDVVFAHFNKVTEVAANGTVNWTRALDMPKRCWLGGDARISGAVIDGISVFVSRSCGANRIGTMMNSPYARAYDLPSSWVARFSRS